MTTVLIVGSGPTGLTLACDLARRGVAVRIVERTSAFPRTSRAKGPNQRSLEIFEDLGVVDRVLAAGSSPLVMRKYFDGVAISDADPYTSFVATPDVPYGTGRLIAQWALEQILRDRLTEFGVRVELGCEVVDLSQDETSVEVDLADGTRITAEYVVGCDGGHSSIRKLLGVPLSGTTMPEQVMVTGDVRCVGLDRGIWHQWFAADGAGLMLCPIPGTTDGWWFQGGPERGADGAVLPPSLDGFRRALEQLTTLPGESITEASLLSTYRVNVRMADRFRVDRVFLAGDAAHVHPIAGGLGMNTGIQDAFNLGWKLGLVAAGRAGPGLLDTYEQERLPVASWTLDATSQRLAAVLDAITVPGGGLDTVVTRDMTGLGVGYRWSPLARSGRVTTTLAAGDRAPDAPLHTTAGTPMRLFEVFAGPHFTALGFGSDADLAAIARRTEEPGGTVVTCGIDTLDGLIDTQGHARRAYGSNAAVDGLVVLVRPDGHVGVIGDAADALTYLATLAD